MDTHFSENLRFLLWQKHPTPGNDWPSRVTRWCAVDVQRAVQLLNGAYPQDAEVAELARESQFEAETLMFQRLLKPSDILANNIRYLFDGLGHGAKGEFASAIDVDASTISRWKRGKLRPSSGHLDLLKRQFGLPAEIELDDDPLFLSARPVSHMQRREWLKARIDDLSLKEMNELFPALYRILGGDHAGN